MKNLFTETEDIFKNSMSESVFDNIDKLISLFEAAEDDAENEAGEADDTAEAEPAGAEGGEDMEMTDPTEPAPDAVAEGQPAEESEGIYVSANQKAVLAKTMLDALQAQPPQAGEIPEELLNVTDANADQVIKFIQSLTSLATALDTSELSDNNPNSLMSELKDAK